MRKIVGRSHLSDAESLSGEEGHLVSTLCGRSVPESPRGRGPSIWGYCPRCTDAILREHNDAVKQFNGLVRERDSLRRVLVDLKSDVDNALIPGQGTLAKIIKG